MQWAWPTSCGILGGEGLLGPWDAREPADVVAELLQLAVLLAVKTLPDFSGLVGLGREQLLQQPLVVLLEHMDAGLELVAVLLRFPGDCSLATSLGLETTRSRG